MPTLDDIVKVDIALETRGVSQGDFSTLMIVAPIASFTERVRSYNSYNSALEDNLPDNVLKALSTGFSQTPRPSVIKVGRRTVTKIVLTASELVNLGKYSFKVNDKEYSFTASDSPSAAAIATGLAAVVAEDGSALITAAASSDVLNISWKNNSEIGALTMGSNMMISSTEASKTTGDVAKDLAEICNEDNSWYGLVTIERDLETQQEVAEWTEANTKLYLTSSSDAKCWSASDDTDLLSVMQKKQYYRTITMAHKESEEYPEVAWPCVNFSYEPGSETWALKQLSGVTTQNFTATQINAINKKNGNYFEKYHDNISLTNPGKVASGEWIDVIRFRDWLVDKIQTDQVQMMINRKKLPYTDAGIQTAVNTLRKSLQEGQNIGGIAPDELDENNNSIPGFEIRYPLASEVSDNDKAARKLTIYFRGRLAGAIHAGDIQGTLSYSL